MTKRLLLAATVAAALALPLRADFNGVVHALGSSPGLRAVPIPFLGLARLAVWMMHPKGVYDFQLATFEGTSQIDGQRIAAILRTNAGAGFQPVVQVHSQRSGEWTFIYARPVAGDRLEMMLVTHDRDDTVAVRAVVDPNRLFDDPHGAVKIAWR